MAAFAFSEEKRSGRAAHRNGHGIGLNRRHRADGKTGHVLGEAPDLEVRGHKVTPILPEIEGRSISAGVPFVATFDGHVQYQGSFAKMGGSHAMILLRKDVKAKLGKEPGETVKVRLELDDKPRKLAVASDITKALQVQYSFLIGFFSSVSKKKNYKISYRI